MLSPATLTESSGDSIRRPCLLGVVCWRRRMQLTRASRAAWDNESSSVPVQVQRSSIPSGGTHVWLAGGHLAGEAAVCPTAHCHLPYLHGTPAMLSLYHLFSSKLNKRENCNYIPCTWWHFHSLNWHAHTRFYFDRKIYTPALCEPSSIDHTPELRWCCLNISRPLQCSFPCLNSVALHYTRYIHLNPTLMML